jgi:nucleoside 2-deoxyribosyltransferase
MMAIASIVAIAHIIGLGLLFWMALRFVKSFGAFVESHERSQRQMLLTHESQILIHQQNMKALERIDAAMADLQRIHSLPQTGAA